MKATVHAFKRIIVSFTTILSELFNLFWIWINKMYNSEIFIYNAAKINLHT